MNGNSPMKAPVIFFTSAALLGAAILAMPRGSQAGTRSAHLSISRQADTCAGLEVKSAGEVARAVESFTAPQGSLEIDVQNRGLIRVIGSNRADYQVEACKLAAADSRAAAERALSSIAVTRSGGRFTESGPSDGEWLVYFIVHAPRDASLDLESRNGPISVRDVAGKIRARAGNGPISLEECGGEIQARTGNGPIRFTGSGGNVSLAAQNGPVSLELSGNEWRGPLLEARTVNGPVSLRVPDSFRSAMRVQTAGHAPFTCRSEVCRNARSDGHGSQRSIRMNGASPVVRLSTEHGPVSVRSDGRGPKVI
jgi:hypothetical protein